MGHSTFDCHPIIHYIESLPMLKMKIKSLKLFIKKTVNILDFVSEEIFQKKPLILVFEIIMQQRKVVTQLGTTL